MTRLTEILMRSKNARNQNRNTKKLTGHFKNHMNTRVSSPLYLRDSVMERKIRINSGGMCLGDLQVLLDCMKLNEFQENTCLEESAKYKSCLEREKKYLDEMRAMTASDQLGEEDRVNYKQVNKLLNMFPNPSPRFYFTHSNKHKLKEPLVIKYRPDEPWALPEVLGKKKI